MQTFFRGLPMLNFESWIARHGEYGVQAMIESIENREKIALREGSSLEERWRVVIGQPPVIELRGAA
jgi:hypothetical protein